MGQVKTPDCEFIDRELRALFPNALEIETRQDTYTQDYIIWITAGTTGTELVQPFRITRDEFLEDDWRSNIRRLVAELTTFAGA